MLREMLGVMKDTIHGACRDIGRRGWLTSLVANTLVAAHIRLALDQDYAVRPERSVRDNELRLADTLSLFAGAFQSLRDDEVLGGLLLDDLARRFMLREVFTNDVFGDPLVAHEVYCFPGSSPAARSAS
jgi:hypothetical protein